MNRSVGRIVALVTFAAGAVLVAAPQTQPPQFGTATGPSRSTPP